MRTLLLFKIQRDAGDVMQSVRTQVIHCHELSQEKRGLGGREGSMTLGGIVAAL